MKTIKNILLGTVAIVGTFLASCDRVNQDTLPTGSGSQNLSLNFTEFRTITGSFSGEDVGFKGNTPTNELFFVHRERDEDNNWEQIMLKYNLTNGTTTEMRSIMIGGATRYIHIIGNLVKVISNTGIFTYRIDLATEPSIEPHFLSITRFGSVLHNGEMYIVGGDLTTRDQDGILSNKIRRWVSSVSQFQAVATMPGSKTWASAEVVGNKIYVFGGQEQWLNTDPQSSVFIYDLASDSFETIHLPEPVNWTYTSVHNGKIIVSGQLLREEADPNVPADRDIFFQLFDPSTNTFSEIETNLSDDGYNTVHDMAIVGNKVFVIYGDPSINHPNVWTIQQATIDF